MSLAEENNYTEDEVESLPDDMKSEFGEVLSSAVLSQYSTIPEDILQFQHSYGYDCKRLYNLCLIDSNTLVFISGNLIHFFDLTTFEITTRRSVLGGGIGCITKNPNPEYNYLTIAENGNFPPIFIYKYPKMEIISMLPDGTTKSYTHISYSPDGELFLSQGGEPDYMITIWNWKDSQIILRSKSFQNDVNNVLFSPYNPGQLTSCGLGHIKFWKMSKTFTGLKLKGELGRFGKTEISDILGIYPMPDEKILSGCEWGNIFVWEDGLIKFEVCRKDRLKMHERPITQIEMIDGEVMTVSMDGLVRIWFWDTVELADPPSDDKFVEIEPIYEYRIGNRKHVCELMWLTRIEIDKSDYKWYAQDGNGGIWICDISPEHKPEQPKQIFRCHAGQIIGLATSPFSTHVATLGEDGRLHIYDYKTRKLLFFKQYPAKGRAIIWLPISVDPSGVCIILGFDDGIIRLVVADLTLETYDPLEEYVKLIQVVKPHEQSITKLSINQSKTILVSGSEDSTIFINQLSQQVPFVVLIPIGLVEMPSPVTAINWKPNTSATILVGCLFGEVVEAVLPERERSYTMISYILPHIEQQKLIFKSTKSQIRRDLWIKEQEEKGEAKRLKKMESLQRLRIENPGVDIDEETFLADSEDEEELEPLFIPKIPNKILWLQYTSKGTIWLSMAGYDAGYIYEYEFGKEDPISCTMIPDGDDIEIHCFIYSKEYLIFGMCNGAIRINRIKEDFCDLSDYWLLNMHDNLNGIIPSIQFSYDHKMCFSIGHDGNLFSYEWNVPLEQVKTVNSIVPEKIRRQSDIKDRSFLSLEQQKKKDDFERRNQIANEKKNQILDILADYKVEFKEIIKRNKKLIESQQITNEDLEVNPRITHDLLESIDEKLNLLQRKFAFDIEKSKLLGNKVKEYFLKPLEKYPIKVQGILSNLEVETFKIPKLNDDFFNLRSDVEERIRIDLERRRIITMIDDEQSTDTFTKLDKVESFLEGLTASTISHKLETKMKRLLEKYRIRKAREDSNKEEWEQIMKEKPDPNVNHSDDIKALEEAKNTIGDYKLKMDPMFNSSDDERDTKLKKFQELLKIRQNIFNIRNDYNESVFELRSKKTLLVEYIKEQLDKLKSIHEELPDSKCLLPKMIPKINNEVEYPERAFKLDTNIENPINFQEVLHRRSMAKSFITKQEIKQHYNFLDLQSEVLGLKVKNKIETEDDLNVNQLLELSKTKIKFSQLDYKTLQKDSETSQWENELRYSRLAGKIFEQQGIIQDIDNKINKFDEDLENNREACLEIEVHAKFLDIYCLTLNQELWILKDFEQLEDNLVEQVDDKLIEWNNEQSNLIAEKNKIKILQKNMENSLEKIKGIQSEFLLNISEDKFADFLKRIFKKKFKTPKEHNSDDSDSSSSSSSSSSDDEDDAASIDSNEIGPIRLDESVCPNGCEANLYDLTFILRSKRHQLEDAVRNDQKSIENSRKEIEFLTKQIKVVEQDLNVNKEKLASFRREKQKMLNQVETLVILNMNQMQYFRNEEEFKDISNTLLFNNSIVAKLYSRVAQIAAETLEANRKHRVNVIHLARMKTDCKFMEAEIVELREQINQTMIKKFGRIVELDELEEAVLKRFVYDMKANCDHIRKDYDKKRNDFKKLYSEKQVVYNRLLHEGIEKLNILTVLQEEENFLTDVIVHQQKNQSRATSVKHLDLNRDVTKLREISRQQREQISILQREIKTLSLKSKPFPPILNQQFYVTEVEESNMGFSDRNYEESMFSSALGSPEQSKGASFDLDDLNDTITIVNRFLLKFLKNKLSDREMKKYGHSIGRYLFNVAAEWNPNQSEEVITCVVDKFCSIIPKQHISSVDPKEIANLFEEILKNIGKLEKTKIDPSEVLEAIICISMETEYDSSVMNFTQEFLTEVLQQLLLTLPVVDAISNERIDQLTALLTKVPNFNPKCINLNKMISDMLNFAAEHLIDGLDISILKPFIESISVGLLGKYAK